MDRVPPRRRPGLAWFLVLQGALLGIGPPVWVVFVSTADGWAFDLSVLLLVVLGWVGIALIVVGGLLAARIDAPLNPGVWRRRTHDRRSA